MKRTVVPVVVLLLVSATFVTAQTTTGRLVGTVVDEEGGALPGVTVTIASPALIGGARTVVTDDQGEFNFVGIAPGEYTVKAERTGWIPQERARVKVSLGHAVSLTLAMPMGTFSGEINVIDETPVIDPTQVNTGQVFDRSYMQNSAIGSVNRNYLTVVNQSAGVAGGGAWAGVPQPSVFGSTIGENAYFIDGVDTTDPTMATATVALNFDAIGEIQFQTGGFEAEYGRATGGILNLVTRSGGNQFSGTLDARYRDASFQESGDHYDTTDLDTSFQQYSATLGGPILRDRMWFFAAYEWTDDKFTPNGSPTTRDDTAQNYLAKITWQIDPGWRLTAKYSGAPSTTDNAAASQWRTAEATAHNETTNTILSADLSSVLSDSLLWNTTVGIHRFHNESYPQSGDLQTIGHYNYDTGLSTHNYGNQQYWGSDRDDFTTDLTWFVDDLAGSHEFKGGIEYSGVALPDEGLCNTGTPNGERCGEGVSGFFFYDIEYGGTLPLFMDESQGFPPEDYAGQVSTAFVQDAWRVTSDLTLKIGIRYDGVTYDNNEGAQVIDMGMWQPRLGAAWDLTGNAKNILRGSWGRFLHPGNLAGVAFATTTPSQGSFWYSCSGAALLYFGLSVDSAEECSAAAAELGFPYRMDHEGWDPFGWMLPPWEIYGSDPTVIAPGLRATYADELILAYEREVGARSSIEFSYIDKKTRDIYDDTCNGNLPTPMEGADCSYYVIANVPGLARDYQGFIVRYETRGLPWLTLLASYTYSESKGSIEYTQNVNGDADIYPWHFENRYGYLSDHRAHQLKLNGFFNIKGDWTIAFDTFWASPFTWAPYENRIDNQEIPYGSHLLEPRGSREANSNYQLDLQLTKGFAIGHTRLLLIGSALNVFSSERPIDLCWHISGCGGFEMGEAIEWQIPRRYEVGVRLEF
jgi:hypothetical protein